MSKISRHLATSAVITVSFGITLGTAFWLSRDQAAGAIDLPLIWQRYFIFANSFLFICFIALAIAYADSRRRILKGNILAGAQTVRLLHHLESISSSRTALSSFSLQHENNPEQHKARTEQTVDLLKFLLDESRSMYEDYLHRSCAVSIKLLVPGNGKKPLVQTYLRDRRSFSARSDLYENDRLYEYDEHSPFSDLVLNADGKDYYVNNDLLQSYKKGMYRNSSPHWQKLYNSALVIPIKAPDEIGPSNLMGFLCIDSKLGKFDDEACVDIGRIVSNCIYLSILELSILSVAEINGQARTGDGGKRADAV